MKYSYYPGCTLKTKAQELEGFALRSAAALGFEMKEQAEWQCCGAVYPMADAEVGARLSAVRALAAAREAKEPLVTLCAACHHVIKRVNHDMLSNEAVSQKANDYLQLPTPYHGESRVLHYLEVLRDEIGFERLAQAVKKPLTGRKIGAYYGCMLLRPSEVMQFDDPENPRILEDFLRALGATPIVYAARNECCGAYAAVKDKDAALELSRSVLRSAALSGAEELVTACPLCQYNLQKSNTGAKPMALHYFTALLAEALDVK